MRKKTLKAEKYMFVITVNAQSKKEAKRKFRKYFGHNLPKNQIDVSVLDQIIVKKLASKNMQ